MAIDEDPEGSEIEVLNRAVPSFTGLCVVEIGCGDGRLTRHYAHAAKSIIAIDPDGTAVAELLEMLPGVDARAIGVETLELPPQSADIVLFSWSL